MGIILGAGLLVFGSFLAWGGLSGNLGAMLAAVFAPNQLTATNITNTGAGPNYSAPAIAGGVGNAQLPSLIGGAIVHGLTGN